MIPDIRAMKAPEWQRGDRVCFAPWYLGNQTPEIYTISKVHNLSHFPVPLAVELEQLSGEFAPQLFMRAPSDGGV